MSRCRHNYAAQMWPRTRWREVPKVGCTGNEFISNTRQLALHFDMPRSVADATRFTATGPYAYSKTGIATTIPISTPPPNESPSQKVARLRAAAQKARLSSESGTIWDRIVVRGQVVADKTHRATTMGLIALSVLGTVVAGYSFLDMAIYNRQKQREFYREQQENYNKVLSLARRAEAEGKLTNDLRIVLDNERAIKEAELAREKKKSLWQNMKDVLFAGPKEERRGGRLATIAHESRADVDVIKDEMMDQAQSSSNIAVESTASVVNPNNGRTLAREIRGGQLDRLGETVAVDLSSTSKRVVSWMMGR